MTKKLDAYSIIYFGNAWFAENKTSSHHIAERLARLCPLLYVECPGLRPPKASGRDFRKLLKTASSTFRPPRRLNHHMWLMTMPQMPFRRIALIRWLNLVFNRWLVKRALRTLAFKDFISWFVVPHPGPLAGNLGDRFVVYYCTDDYASFPNVDSGAVSRMDDHLTRRANQVFVSSPTLIESKRRLNASTCHAPHGVDVNLFKAASDPTQEKAEPCKDLRTPVIGFFGLIEAWIDLDLIRFLATERPEWTILMIGRVASDTSTLAHLPNVIMPGPQPYNTLPSWARAFDVAVIPYRPTRQVMHANPLKLREYLATGKPIVTVRTPEVEKFADYVSIADNREDFLTAIEAALRDDSPSSAERRIGSVRDMTWDARVQDLLNIVAPRLR